MQSKDSKYHDTANNAEPGSVEAARIVDATPTAPAGSRPQRAATNNQNITSVPNVSNVTNTKPKTTNAVTSTHIVTADSVAPEEVPTIPIGSLETITGRHAAVSVRSVSPSSGQMAGPPTPLVVQPAEYHRGFSEWVQVWWDGIRPRYLLLSVVPVCVGSILAWTQTVAPHKLLGHFHFSHFIGILLATVLIQSGAHLVNDYYDYIHGIDRSNPFGPGGLIQQGILRPTTVLNAGLGALALGFIVGVVIAFVGGPLVFLLGALGLLAAYFYSATSHSLSSLALGDVVAFFIFGPLITAGAYLVMLRTGSVDRSVIACGTILGLFAAAVIHVNNMRDIEGDEQAGKRTLASILGLRWSRVLYAVFILLAYILILGMGLPHGAPHFLLLTLWTLPMLAVVLTGIIRAGAAGSFNAVVRQTLRLETYFALFLIIGLILTVLLPLLPLPHLPAHILP